MRQVDDGVRWNHRKTLLNQRLRRYGVADGARTHDNRNHNPGLYQLSYSHRKLKIIACPCALSTTGRKFSTLACQPGVFNAVSGLGTRN